MHSYLIVSKLEEPGQKQAETLIKEFSIDRFDQIVIESERAIGIEEVRNLQKSILLKPGKGKTKAIIVKNAEALTIEAQNALLKTLEEPPDNTIIILLAESKATLLPTILSRCKVIEMKEKSLQLSDEEQQEHTLLLVSLQSEGIGYRLKLAQDFGKDRETALTFLEKLILVAREQLLKADKQEYVQIIRQLQKYYIDIKTTNINPRLALENLFLSLS